MKVCLTLSFIISLYLEIKINIINENHKELVYSAMRPPEMSQISAESSKSAKSEDLNSHQKVDMGEINPLNKEELLLNERIIPHITALGYFDDPLLPYRMREVIMLKENKQLLRHYETSLPSWTVVMAQYAYYRPSFRKFQYWFMMFISLVSMMIGFFDLYKNLPIVKPFLKTYMGWIWNFLETHVILRMSFFLGYLFTNSMLTANLAIYVMQLPLLGQIAK